MGAPMPCPTPPRRATPVQIVVVEFQNFFGGGLTSAGGGGSWESSAAPPPSRRKPGSPPPHGYECSRSSSRSSESSPVEAGVTYRGRDESSKSRISSAPRPPARAHAAAPSSIARPSRAVVSAAPPRSSDKWFMSRERRRIIAKSRGATRKTVPRGQGRRPSGPFDPPDPIL